MNSRCNMGEVDMPVSPLAMDPRQPARAHAQLRSFRRRLPSTLPAKLAFFFASFAPCAFASRVSAPPLNHPAPEFTLTDLNHKRLDLHAYRGKVILLDFWATWCAPCQVEIPHFIDWQNEYKSRGLQVIGISMDDDPALAKKLYQRLHMNYPVALGDAKLGQSYGGIYGLPVTFLIDRDGRIRAEYQGAADLHKIEAQMRSMLNLP
ncbi:MAG: redoxin domain-containing protein [Acidobacteriaceae bacterium]